jgi:hypothetical protein
MAIDMGGQTAKAIAEFTLRDADSPHIAGSARNRIPGNGAASDRGASRKGVNFLRARITTVWLCSLQGPCRPKPFLAFLDMPETVSGASTSLW